MYILNNPNLHIQICGAFVHSSSSGVIKPNQNIYRPVLQKPDYILRDLVTHVMGGIMKISQIMAQYPTDKNAVQIYKDLLHILFTIEADMKSEIKIQL